MSDIASLKQRIEHAELRLKTAYDSRQRESTALTAMWNQIRDRFAAQGAEIGYLRSRVAELEDTRDQLQSMVLTLLGAVESSVDRMADETVPRITGLAEDLLETDLSQDASEAPPLPRSADLPKVRPEGSGRSPADPSSGTSGDVDFLALLASHLDREDTVPSPPPHPSEDGEDVDPGEAISPGIRSLIKRIEGAGSALRPQPSSSYMDEDEEEDVELSRDINDIKRLREELESLRERIGATGR